MIGTWRVSNERNYVCYNFLFCQVKKHDSLLQKAAQDYFIDY